MGFEHSCHHETFIAELESPANECARERNELEFSVVWDLIRFVLMVTFNMPLLGHYLVGIAWRGRCQDQCFKRCCFQSTAYVIRVFLVNEPTRDQCTTTATPMGILWHKATTIEHKFNRFTCITAVHEQPYFDSSDNRIWVNEERFYVLLLHWMIFVFYSAVRVTIAT